MKEINPGEQIIFLGDRKLKVELDKRALFALASDTRLDILKALHMERRTVSQLADELKVDKAAIHRHLKKLEEGGLVVRTEDHGFIYYALTWKARDIVSPGENTKIVFLISAICLMLVVASLMTVVALDHQAPRAQEASGDYTEPPNTPSETTRYDSALELTASGAMAIIVVLVSVFVVRMVWRPKQPKPQDFEDLVIVNPGIDD